MELQGIRALVTGANRGIGAAIVAELLAARADIVYAGVRNPGRYDAPDARVRALRLDVTDEASVVAAAAAVPTLDLLVNNAGVLTNSAYLAAGALEGARTEMETNYWGVLRVCRAFAPHLRASGRAGGAMLVNVLSPLARVTYPFCGTYCGSKHATYSLTLGLRAELAADHVHVLEAYPGLTDTDMAAGLEHLPKATPAEVAREFIRAMRENLESVFVGEDALATRDLLATDARAAQAQASQYLPQ